MVTRKLSVIGIAFLVIMALSGVFAASANAGYNVIFDMPDTPWCIIEAGKVHVSGRVEMPDGETADLQLSQYVVPQPIQYWSDGTVHNGSTFSLDANWPGIKPGQSQIEIHVGANLIDKHGNPLMDWGAGVDFYQPYGCTTTTDTPDTPNVPQTPNPVVANPTTGLWTCPDGFLINGASPVFSPSTVSVGIGDYKDPDGKLISEVEFYLDNGVMKCRLPETKGPEKKN
jgi:hypothetical protein